jgi:type I restriction enzyme S subunit
MRKWRTVNICECARVVSGATPDTTKSEYWDGNINWTTPKDISELNSKYLFSTPRHITESGLRNCAAELLPINSVLFSSRAPIGLVAINKIPTATNQGFKSFIPDINKLDSLYLYYWLKANRKNIEKLGVGATFKEVNKKIVENIKIPLPTIEEQKRIAAILDSADAIRTKRKAAIAKLDELAQSIFLDMFGSSVTDSKYDIGTIRPFVSAGSGKTTRSVTSSIPTDIPIYGGNGKTGFATKALFTKPVLVFGRVGQQCGITRMTEGPAWITDNAIYVVINDEKKLNYQYILMAYRISNFSESVKHLDLPFINQSMILDYTIPIPPIKIQDKYEQLIYQIRVNQQLYGKALQQDDTLFSSLQQRAFAGEL